MQASPIKVNGGKSYLSKWIVEQFPSNYTQLTYVEPFCGGISVLLHKARSVKEIINDTDQGIISLLKALRDEPKELIGRLKHVRCCEKTFLATLKKSKEIDDYVDRAVREFILRQMSRGGMKKTFVNSASTWESTVKKLPSIAARLEDVIILCEDFRKIIDVWDEEDSLFHLDPPDLPRTDGQLADNEMSVEDHIVMLNIAKNARGKFLISGYSSSLYNRMLDKSVWQCKKRSVNKSKAHRTECLWLN
jgi:DNA adenine methylase